MWTILEMENGDRKNEWKGNGLNHLETKKKQTGNRTHKNDDDFVVSDKHKINEIIWMNLVGGERYRTGWWDG